MLLRDLSIQMSMFWGTLMERLLLQKSAIKTWEVWHFVFLDFGSNSLSNILTLY